MLIIFDANGKRLNDFGTNSLYPDGVPYDPAPEEYVFRIQDGDPLVPKIFDAETIKGIIVEGSVTNIVLYSRIAVTVDKQQITADGLGTATITATVDDPTSTEMIELWKEGTLVDSIAAVNGHAQFQITMTELER